MTLIGLAITGLFIRIYSVWTLRKYFTLNVQVSTEQKIIKNGPYQYIRHPAYTGSILSLSGIAVSFRSPLGILLTAVIIAAAYGYRIHTEELALEKSFGQPYKDYEKQTWRLVPHIW